MNRIREFREQKGLSQEELAKLVGLSQGTISKYEAGRKDLTVAKARLFADQLGTTTNEIMGLSRAELAKLVGLVL